MREKEVSCMQGTGQKEKGELADKQMRIDCTDAERWASGQVKTLPPPNGQRPAERAWLPTAQKLRGNATQGEKCRIRETAFAVGTEESRSPDQESTCHRHGGG